MVELDCLMSRRAGWKKWGEWLRGKGLYLHPATWPLAFDKFDTPRTFEELKAVVPTAYPGWWEKHGASVMALDGSDAPVSAEEIQKRVKEHILVGSTVIDLPRAMIAAVGVGTVFSNAQVGEVMDICMSSVTKALKACVANGTVEKVGHGAYKVIRATPEPDARYKVDSSPWKAKAVARFATERFSAGNFTADTLVERMTKEGYTVSRKTASRALRTLCERGLAKRNGKSVYELFSTPMA